MFGPNMAISVMDISLVSNGVKLYYGMIYTKRTRGPTIYNVFWSIP